VTILIINEKSNLSKAYKASETEGKWQKIWSQWEIYNFDHADLNRPTYSIDTPPPYPSGEFHMGNALNWCYFDFVARYKRMKGFNVHFPQGWDCHGLPTEVRAEKAHKIRKRDIPIKDFKDLCTKLTNEFIKKMKTAMSAMGYSMDWNLEYKTMDPKYYSVTQLSFLILYENGYIYRGEHPVNWCPRCETAIAEAEVTYIERDSEFISLTFGNEKDKLLIATTRPELLPACVAVAVNPNDDRHKYRIGKEIEIPLFKRKVKIYADEDVDPAFGTGVVMVCTFGDKTDVKWQKKYDLPIVSLVTEDGHISEAGGKYKGLTLNEAKQKIIEDLKKKNSVEKTQNIKQNIGSCWRCNTPVEIISRMQWFMTTRNMTDDVLQWSEKVNWVPDFSKYRMIDWAKSLDWDWVISRQRIFATPIPIWYCKKCSQVIIANQGWLPVDPRFESPKLSKCPKCGCQDFVGETDVMDTWMDSSITCAYHAGWPYNDESMKRLFPADLQPNGLDIIRTWDYYLMVKSLALFGKAPYKTVLINGMVRGADGRMMHKSFGNYVEAQEAIRRYGADPLRQWAAAGGATGYDLPFNWSEVEHGKKFLTKLWNAAKFVIINLNDFQDYHGELELVDRWVLTKLEKLTESVSKSYEKFEFNNALEAIRHFTWHTFCDQYLEAVKHRLYNEEKKSIERRKAAQFTLYHCLFKVIQLLAPICPHICEEIYQNFPVVLNRKKSIHITEWPEPNMNMINDQVENEGDVLLAIVSEIRRIKSENKISLKAPIATIQIYTDQKFLNTINTHKNDIAQIIHANQINIGQLENDSSGKEMQNYPNIRVNLII
jgi:valyl-tRNA synthetase